MSPEEKTLQEMRMLRNIRSALTYLDEIEGYEAEDLDCNVARAIDLLKARLAGEQWQ